MTSSSTVPETTTSAPVKPTTAAATATGAPSHPVSVAILGAGRIAESMAATLTAMAADPRYSALVRPYAVAARDAGRAHDFAARHGIPVSFGSYEELVADPTVDLVYIATPHSLHAEQALMCLRAGKGVLVEKAFTVNAGQAQEVIDLAESSRLACVEAIWTRFMPSRRIIDEVLASGVIGEVKAVTANLGYPTTHKARIVDPALAGGALLDVGVYALNFIDMALGPRPIARIDTSMSPWSTGVDAQNATTLWYEDGTMASATSSMVALSDRTGAVWGTEGYLLCRNINNVESVDVFARDHRPIAHHDVPPQLTGYEYEVAAAAHAVLEGRSECPEMPHADTLRMMGLMDRIRGEWGLRYPDE